jgi:hypothetical protein
MMRRLRDELGLVAGVVTMVSSIEQCRAAAGQNVTNATGRGRPSTAEKSTIDCCIGWTGAPGYRV